LRRLSPAGEARSAENDLGRVLQVGVHHDDCAAGGVVEAGSDRDLVAETAR
jgi:hypothetical protein